MQNLQKISRSYLKPVLSESSFYTKVITKDKNFVEMTPNPDKSKTTPILIERFSSEALTPSSTYFSVYHVDFSKEIGYTVADLLTHIRETVDSSLAFRQSCKVGLCGICSMNINGKNTLACTAPLTPNTQMIIRPLSGFPVIHDLVVDLEGLYSNFKEIRPWLEPAKLQQSPENRKKLEKFLPCSLCGCCNASSPAFWWNSEKYYGPAVLLQAYRWIIESRDKGKADRLLLLSDFDQDQFESVECDKSCPIGLDPESAVKEIKRELKGLKKTWNDWVEFGNGTDKFS